MIISPPKSARLVETVCIPFKKRLRKRGCSTRPTRSRARVVRTSTCHLILLDSATAMMGGLRRDRREGGGRMEEGSARKVSLEGVDVLPERQPLGSVIIDRINTLVAWQPYIFPVALSCCGLGQVHKHGSCIARPSQVLGLVLRERYHLLAGILCA